ncbi:MAG: hypothetical protein KIT84_01835 [Labilithrix sp.]|nr:hypothetical protein [Labilithrix sp.]MCW5809728.1 hypothetical protein [Labilithrix sp.]
MRTICFLLVTVLVACGSSIDVDDAEADADAQLAAAPTPRPTPTPTPTPTPSAEPTIWPNAKSRATSDPWLVANHDRLREMRPKVLTINFDNDATSKARWRTRVEEVIAGLAEGSRYHGYDDDRATPFLRYEVAKWVDLSDPAPVEGWKHAVSTKYPVRCAGDAFYKFDYAALFEKPEMTAAFGAPLCDLFARGDVHEVWLYANGDPEPYTCPDGTVLPDMGAAEILESKPIYANGRATGRFERCAGNGCLGDRDFAAFEACGRTVRVLYINSSRGPGCALHSAGHGYERMANSGAVPELKPRFAAFAGLDLRERHRLPFDSWYACNADDSCRTFTGPNGVDWQVGSKRGHVEPYDQPCGNVHFAPNARKDYDENDTQVLSSCAHFGLRDGANGKDAAELFSRATYAQYKELAPDCGGAWQVYWRQSFPGLDNVAKDAKGKSQRNWWPYLFY